MEVKRGRSLEVNAAFFPKGATTLCSLSSSTSEPLTTFSEPMSTRDYAIARGAHARIRVIRDTVLGYT